MAGRVVVQRTITCRQPSRVTPHMQEQDPRRDVLGCNRTTKRRLQTNPRKNRSQSKRNARFTFHKHSSRLCPLRERAAPRKNQENDLLTTKPLSGMGHPRRLRAVQNCGRGAVPARKEWVPLSEFPARRWEGRRAFVNVSFETDLDVI